MLQRNWDTKYLLWNDCSIDRFISDIQRQTNTYTSKYITQLTQNYRSHKAILHAPNVLFYDETLEAKATDGLFENDLNSQSQECKHDFST